MRNLMLVACMVCLWGCDDDRKEAPKVEEPASPPEAPPPPPKPEPRPLPKVDVEAEAKKCVENEDKKACKLACQEQHARSCSLWGLKLRLDEMRGTARKGAAVAAHKKACELGDGFGCYESKNYEKGLKLMARQCGNDDAMACRTLGFSYESGRHLEKDETMAMSMFAMACKLGDEIGCHNENRLKGD